MNAPANNITVGNSVYAKIAAVQGELAKVGIGKNNNNTQQNYRFRGIDDVYNALAPLLAKHGLCVLPRMVGRDREERVTVKEWNGQRKESVLFYVTVDAEFDFVSSDDGSAHTVRTFGEAMDSGDKATNKAMSAAYKYAAFMTFAIPTEGDNDADATTHEVASRREGQSEGRAVSPPADMPDSEWAKLVQLLEATKADRKAMLDYYNVENLRQLNQDQYGHAVKSLTDKLAKLAKEQTDTKAGNLAEALDDAITF